MSYLKLSAIPSSNCVYVDNDYIGLRAKGLLAYRTVEDAVVSWRAGGEARIKYGTPTATSRGTIILGAGKIESAKSTTTTEVDIDVDYLNVVGQGKDATIVTTVNSLSQNILAIAATNINFFDFTLFGSTTASSIFRLAVATYSGTWHNVKITGDAISNYVAFGVGSVNMVGAAFYDCEFDFSNGTATPSAAMNLGGSGDLNVWKFFNCVFKANSSVNKILSMTGKVLDGHFVNCMFIGNTAQSLVESGNVYYLGSFRNCVFDSSSSTSAIGLKISDTDPEMIIQGCVFTCRGSCISGGLTNRTRIVNNDFHEYGTNIDVINCIGAIGFVIYGCRLMTNGTGLAINADTVFNAQISHCTLRKPTVNTPGSSISANITNVITTPFNSEVDTSVSYY